MKKYTIIYSESFQIGSHRHSIVKLQYIECKPKELVEIVEEKGIEFGWVNYILDGHCEQS